VAEQQQVVLLQLPMSVPAGDCRLQVPVRRKMPARLPATRMWHPRAQLPLPNFQSIGNGQDPSGIRSAHTVHIHNLQESNPQPKTQLTSLNNHALFSQAQHQNRERRTKQNKFGSYSLTTHEKQIEAPFCLLACNHPATLPPFNARVSPQADLSAYQKHS
jgi:hypothetical protein